MKNDIRHKVMRQVVMAASLLLPAAWSQALIYTATPAQGQAVGGTFNYFDDTGNQLLDGITGTDNWMADLGNGAAYEWVGWRTVSPIITFDFGSPVQIIGVEIGLNRNQGDGIFLPQTIAVGSASFTLDNSEVFNGARAFVSYALNQAASSITLTLSDSDDGRWIFVDEIRFTTVPVPEPGTAALLLLGLLPVAWRLRERSKRR